MVTAKSNLSLQIGPWIRRALEWRVKRNIGRGFLFINELGRIASLKDFEGDILFWVTRVQRTFIYLFFASSNAQEKYGLSMLFRRGSNSESYNRGVSDAAIDTKNRWCKIEQTGTRKAKL